MKSYLSLAWKELKVQKVTSALIIIAFVLSSTATAAISQSVGILQAMRIEQAAGLNGNRYATFHQLTEEEKELLHADSRLKNVGSLINLGTVALDNSELTLFLREYQGTALEAYPDIGKVAEGRLPKEAGEIALSQDALQSLNLEKTLGATVTLPVSVSRMSGEGGAYEYTADFVLTGILENAYYGYATGIIDGVVGEGTAKRLLPAYYFLYSTDFKTKSIEQFQPIVDDLAGQLKVLESNIQYNWILLDTLGVQYREADSSKTAAGFPFMMMACVLTGVLILLAAGLVIYNILKVSVTKRIGEFGTLRAIGSDRKCLYRLVIVQLLVLCIFGLPIGVLLGIFSAKGILIAAVGMLNPSLFMASDELALNAAIGESNSSATLPAIVSILVTLLFASLAAFPSARYAAHVSPTAAMGGQAVSIRRRNRKQKRIRNFEAFYAWLNIKRSRSRTMITILSMVMSITVFVALQSFVGLMDTSRRVQDMHIGDYDVTSEAVGILPEAIRQMAEQEMVAALSTAKLKVYSADENGNRDVELDISLQAWEAFGIAGIDESRLVSYISGLSEADIEDLKNGTACLVKNPIPFSYDGEAVPCTELQKDDTITVNQKKLRVAGIADAPVQINNGGYLNGVQIIVTDMLYDRLTGEEKYSEIYPVLKDIADAESFENWLDQWCEENIGSHWLSYRKSDAQMAESFEQINLLCWGLILFIGLIGILNIINTVYTNIHTRINEIGMQRAIGMSAQSLYKTFLWEGAYYGLISSAIGAVCGYACKVFIDAGSTSSLQLTAVPLIPILEAAAVSVFACLLATAVPLYGIGKMSIVDSIERVE